MNMKKFGIINISMKHKHHIIPKHAGGTDSPENIIKLTVEEHADTHKKLWEEYGRKEDLLAWKGLTGQIGKDEILHELCKIGGSKNGMKGRFGKDNPNYGSKRSEETKQIMSLKMKVYQNNRTKIHKDSLNNRFTKEYINKVTNSISRDWRVTYPSGNENIIHNMAEFCRENNLNRGQVSTTAKTGKSYRGFRFQKLT